MNTQIVAVRMHRLLGFVFIAFEFPTVFIFLELIPTLVFQDRREMGLGRIRASFLSGALGFCQYNAVLPQVCSQCMSAASIVDG